MHFVINAYIFGAFYFFTAFLFPYHTCFLLTKEFIHINYSTIPRERKSKKHAIIKLVIKMKVGKKITSLRKKRKLTQQQLGDLLFVSDKTISSWEADRTEPSLDMILKLSEVLTCSIKDLMDDEKNNLDIETEIKIKLTQKEFQTIHSFMDEHAKFLKHGRQKDTYFQPLHRRFLEEETINEWLRIGERGNKKIINYKNWHDNMYCDEYEVEIDNTKNMDKIFHILGLEKIAVVDKTRTSYLYLDKYEIALDYVKELGYFIEIEVKSYTDTPINEYENLLKLTKQLNLNLEQIDKRGYPYHFIFKDL